MGNVDNRIPSYPYMELNGISVYVEGVLPKELGWTAGIGLSHNAMIDIIGFPKVDGEKRDVKKH